MVNLNVTYFVFVLISFIQGQGGERIFEVARKVRGWGSPLMGPLLVLFFLSVNFNIDLS